jgi:hypothetical protein
MSIQASEHKLSKLEEMLNVNPNASAQEQLEAIGLGDDKTDQESIFLKYFFLTFVVLGQQTQHKLMVNMDEFADKLDISKTIGDEITTMKNAMLTGQQDAFRTGFETLSHTILANKDNLSNYHELKQVLGDIEADIAQPGAWASIQDALAGGGYATYNSDHEWVVNPNAKPGESQLLSRILNSFSTASSLVTGFSSQVQVRVQETMQATGNIESAFKELMTAWNKLKTSNIAASKQHV